MNPTAIAQHRLASQQLYNKGSASPAALVSAFGAMQAQDYAMAKYAIGVRTGITEAAVQQAIDNGEIVRTHILRPTWHLVASKDIHWMLSLTAPHVKKLITPLLKNMELTVPVLTSCYTAIKKLLKGRQLTRGDIMAALGKAGIATNDLRASLIMMLAELDGVVCNGLMQGKQHTYALLHERIAAAPPIPKEEALAKLADKYFSCHGPATIMDFMWWSGLSLTDATIAFNLAKPSLQAFQAGKQTYLFKESSAGLATAKKTLLLLPAFDEFIIGYRDRSASLETKYEPEILLKNGIFKAAIVLNGRVVGSWKRKLTKQSVLIEPSFFSPPAKSLINYLDNAAQGYGNFLALNSILNFN